MRARTAAKARANDGVTIGPAARAAEVNVETIRFYERQGLIEQPSTQEGFRRYDEATIRQIRFIKRAQEIGFTLKEIHDLLTLHDDDCGEARRRAEGKLQSVEVKIRDLERIAEALRKLISACARNPAKGPCAILDTLHERTSKDGRTT